MARQATIHIVIRDKADGSGVEIGSKPAFSEMALRIQNFGDTALTPAEAYAISMLNAARKHGEEADKNMGRGSIILPGLRQ